eukprot:TRINITY_DN269_c0_g2_i5.p1 TRINITY_DN269_c0_g2~~TRINITY_DN269_c0_g2_i5.p1  ORF type:complete len:168 (-),score=34.04 TRINITY_DN269_c0_g2_i5:404-907(-)
MSDDGNNHSKSRRDLATEFTPYQKAEQHRETLQKEYYFLHNHAANRDTTNRKVDHNMTISYTNTVSSTDRMHRTMGDHEPRCRYQFDLSDPKGEMCRRCKRDHITCKHKADKHLSPQETFHYPPTTAQTVGWTAEKPVDPSKRQGHVNIVESTFHRPGGVGLGRSIR